jgi:hypothetical protein
VSKTADKQLLYNVHLQLIQGHGKHFGKHKVNPGGLNQRLMRSVKDALMSGVVSSLIGNKAFFLIRISN